MRCFLAVETTPEVRRGLLSLQERITADRKDIRPVRPEQLHLTLVFLGDVADDLPTAIAGPLTEACAGQSVFRLQFAGLGAFPQPRRARVLWVGVEQGRTEIVRLQRSIAAGLASVGCRIEQRPFSPHLTIGRLRFPADLAGVVGTAYPGDEMPVERVVLMRSELRSDGPRYTELAEYRLNAKPSSGSSA